MLIGRLAAAACMGVLSSAITALVVIFGYRVPPVHPLEVACAIVCTVTTANFPTAVSPLSITASVPSKIALATSLTSARVGELFSIML